MKVFCGFSKIKRQGFKPVVSLRSKAKCLSGLKVRESIKQYPKPVVALGVFDGLHSAHRHILSNTGQFAREIKGTSVVVTFYPHPQKKESLYSLKQRIRLSLIHI